MCLMHQHRHVTSGIIGTLTLPSIYWIFEILSLVSHENWGGKMYYTPNVAFIPCSLIISLSLAVLKHVSLTWLKETTAKPWLSQTPPLFPPLWIHTGMAKGWWKNWGSYWIQENIMLPMRNDRELWVTAFSCVFHIYLSGNCGTFYSTPRENK